MLEKIDAKKYQRVLSMARQHPNVDLSSLEATIALAIVSEKLEASLECNLGRYNLSRGRFRVLVELSDAADHGLTPADLADRIQVSRGTMTGLIDGLEKELLLVRIPSPEDRRTILVKITPLGMDFTQKVLPENFRRANSMMQNLSLDDKETLVALLAKILDGLKSYQIG